MFKVALVFGTRPEAIKMAPVAAEFQKQGNWDAKVIVTGQHREMLDQVLQVFDLKPDFDLDLMTHGQSLSTITIGVLQGLDDIFKEWKPDLVLVHGDTTTAFAGALASFYWKIRVGHVEAGLRTPTIASPFPEEANRRLVDVLADLYFAPTAQAEENLRKEGVEKNRVFVTGNTVIDALLSVVEEDYQFQDPVLKKIDFSRPLVVVTAHRRENWGEPLIQICEALLEINERDLCEIVVAMHRNPDIRRVMLGRLGEKPRIHLVDAPDYKEFANLLGKSTLLLTDSGGLQEEAPALHKPVLVMREVTERPEAVQAGTARLVGVDKDTIVRSVLELLTDEEAYRRMSNAPNPYGDGLAAKRIRQIVQEEYMSRRNCYGNET